VQFASNGANTPLARKGQTPFFDVPAKAQSSITNLRSSIAWRAGSGVSDQAADHVTAKAAIMTSNQCAYCGAVGPMTREHIWPKCFLERVQSYNIRYSGRAKKVFAGDFTVKDVCATCNNGELSKLDAYLCALYDKYFTEIVQEGDTIAFEYDFGQLTRWLLKISYNSSRTTGNDRDLLTPYAPVICAQQACSPIHAVAFIATARPCWVKHKTRGRVRLDPLGFRCARLQVVTDEEVPFALRLVSMNSYLFFIMLMKQPIVDLERMSDLLYGIPGTPILPSGKILIPPPKLTALDALSGIESWPVRR
jgi:hypothetical protein